MIVSFGYLILRQALQLIILLARGERANAVEVLVLRHQVDRAGLEPVDAQGSATGDYPSSRDARAGRPARCRRHVR